MARTASTRKTRKTTGPKPDAYQVVTDRIIEALEAGIVPWRRPWKTVGPDANVPVSLSTGRPYRGVNVLILMVEQMVHGYTSPRWATYNQIKARGGNVRKGEKATQIVLWRPVEFKTDAVDDDGEKVSKRGLVLRYYSVFNLAQADGIDSLMPDTDPVDDADAFEPCDAADQIVAGFDGAPTIGHGGDRAFYNSGRDHVQVPPQTAFDDCDRYYATLFHELVHSTGHEKRLDRKFGDSFGDEPYSREELVAEIGACFLMSEAGVEPAFDQTAAYIKSWTVALADDKKLIVIAAAQAQKAADLILGKQTSAPVEAVA